jgi:metal-responsive CopG/Arc/MetJ family transcriptional regulator
MIKGSGVTDDLTICLSSRLLKLIDKERGLVSRSAFIRAVIEESLKKGRRPSGERAVATPY